MAATLKAASAVTVLLGAALALSGAAVLHGMAPSRPVDTGAIPPALSSTAPSVGGGVLPVRLGIPALHIDAAIHPVGVDADGALRVPAHPDQLGWWSGGARPGSAAGRVVIVGHVDTAAQGPGAFFRLAHVEVGDKVRVQLADGQSRTYRIVARRHYRKDRLPAQVFAQTGPPCLVLITCTGPFDRATRHYRDNLVVYALPT
ncbi:class F sortase [Nonomuraea sp. NPDC050536]|uniref:class F sortase n=1 Tax=Nonomuraea sp. NPDC050536 TaxID=3364366 RepID=UPI0037C7B2EA